jgi:hypothetical protein
MMLWWYSQQVHAECSHGHVSSLGLTVDVWTLQQVQQPQEPKCHTS